MIEPGAFKSAKPPVPMLAYHDPAKPVGAWDAIAVKSDGLHVAGKLLVEDVALAREVRALVKAGAVKGLSIGFSDEKSRHAKRRRAHHHRARPCGNLACDNSHSPWRARHRGEVFSRGSDCDRRGDQPRGCRAQK